MSATWRHPWLLSGLCSSQPFAACPAAGNCARLAGSAPRPTVKYIPPVPLNDTSDGPRANDPSGSAIDGRPVNTRLWLPFQILVTAPLVPQQTSPPSGPGEHGPSPPRPASAT